jgi:hypothetical protein
VIHHRAIHGHPAPHQRNHIRGRLITAVSRRKDKVLRNTAVFHYNAPMSTRVFWLKRIGFCTLLGGVTAWLVAWGLVVAMWKGVLTLPLTDRPRGNAIVGPHLVRVSTGHSSICRTTWWHFARIDTSDPPMLAPPIQLVPDWDADAGQTGPPMRRLYPASPRLDRMATAFETSNAASSVGDAGGYSVIIHAIGWPLASVTQISVMESSGNGLGPGCTTLGLVSFNTDEKTVPLPWIKGHEPVWSDIVAKPQTIQLPYRPAWLGLTLNTGFYGLLWSLPIIGLPHARRWRRVRKGHCGNCGYDLSRTDSPVCPECGKTSDGS